MENAVFKQSLMGFDRSQVLEYIDNLSRSLTRQADQYKQQMESLQKDLDGITGQLESCRESLAVSDEQARRLKQQVDSLRENNETLQKQTRDYTRLIKQKNRELSSVKEVCNDLSEKVWVLERENRQWKAKQDEIGACMVEAQVRAKMIIEDANRKASSNKARFDENAAGLMTKVADVKSQINRLESRLDDSFRKLTEAMKSMDEAGNRIESQVREYREKVGQLDKEKSVASELSDLRDEAQKKNLTDSVLDAISKLMDK